MLASRGAGAAREGSSRCRHPTGISNRKPTPQADIGVITVTWASLHIRKLPRPANLWRTVRFLSPWSAEKKNRQPFDPHQVAGADVAKNCMETARTTINKGQENAN